MRSGFSAAVAIVVALCGASSPTFSQITVPGDAPPGGVEPAASARFEPETGRVGRPVVYRVTITAAQRPLEPPEPPAPTGMDVAFAGGTISTVILNGMPAITSTFNYSVVGQRAGKLTMPAFEVAVAGKRVRVPPAVLTVAEPEAGEAPYQPVRV
jgi:hypothetical protein